MAFSNSYKPFPGRSNNEPRTGDKKLETMSNDIEDQRREDDEYEFECIDDTKTNPFRKAYPAMSIALVMVAFLLGIDSSVVAAALPLAVPQFGELNHLGWYGGAYLLTFVAFLPVSTQASKFFKLQPLYIISMLLCGVGSIVTASADSAVVFIIGRLVSGLFGSAIFSSIFALVRSHGSKVQQSKNASFLRTIYMAGLASGPLVGCFAAELNKDLAWAGCFWLFPIFGSLSLSLASCQSFPSPSQSLWVSSQSFSEKIRLLDLAGSFLLAGSFACLIFTFQLTGSRMTGSMMMMACSLFLCFLIMLRSFLVRDRHRDRLFVPLHLLKDQTVASCLFVILCFGVGTGIHLQYLPWYCKAVFEDTDSRLNVVLLGYLAGLIFFPTFSKSIIPPQILTMLIALASLIFSVSALVLHVPYEIEVGLEITLNTDKSTDTLFSIASLAYRLDVLFVTAGFGGIGVAVAFTLLQIKLNKKLQAAAVPVFVSCYSAGCMLGVIIAGMIMSRDAVIRSGDVNSKVVLMNANAAFNDIFGIPAAAGILAFLACFAFLRHEDGRVRTR